jgi:hypothetical protein
MLQNKIDLLTANVEDLHEEHRGSVRSGGVTPVFCPVISACPQITATQLIFTPSQAQIVGGAR